MKSPSSNAAPLSTAWSVVVLVAVLALLGASPRLHRWLHGRVCGLPGAAAGPAGREGGKPHPFAVRVPSAAVQPRASLAASAPVQADLAPAAVRSGR